MILFFLFVIGIIVVLGHIIPTRGKARDIPCNERRKPHKWEWVNDGYRDRLECQDCGYIFGED